MTAIDERPTSTEERITSQALLDELVAAGIDEELVQDITTEMVEHHRIAHQPADDATPRLLTAAEAQSIGAQVRVYAAPPACPPWCAHEAGHEYPFATLDGLASRAHVDVRSDDERCQGLLVTVTADEQVELDGTVTLGRPYLTIWARGERLRAELSGFDALDLAQALLAGTRTWLEVSR